MISPAELARRPIGVFDSGVGGLTVMAALRERMPAESILYLGDTARLPYGTKSEDTVTRYTRANLGFLLGRGVKAVVVACNTASALALPHLELPVPVWGVIEAGAEAALAATRGGRIGVIATESTVRSGAYPAALAVRRSGLEVVSLACPLFVPLVEEGWSDDPVAQLVAERYLRPLLAPPGIDTLVLGCTHYPLLTGTIAAVLGPAVTLVDSAHAIAERVARDLESLGLCAPADQAPELHIAVTDKGERFERIAREILGDGPLRLELVDVTGDGLNPHPPARAAGDAAAACGS